MRPGLSTATKHSIEHSFVFQDIELLKQWSWNATLEKYPSILTEVGYDELYNIAKRIKEKFPNLLNGDDAKFYFRSTRKQRTAASGKAFLAGLSENTKLNLTLDKPARKDQVLKVTTKIVVKLFL